MVSLSPNLSALAPLREALQNLQYRRYTIGNAVSLSGTWMQRLAVGWLAWHLTDSGGWLGLVVFADLFPTVCVSPIAGAVADRLDRLRLTRAVQVFALAQAAALAVLTAAGLINIWLLAGLSVIGGTIAAFDQPARAALVPAIVAREHLAGAIAVHSSIFSLARFVGPAVAGFFLLVTGPAGAFFANALSYGAFLLALSTIRIHGEARASQTRSSFARSVSEGIGYAVRHQGIATVLVMLAALGVGGRPLIDLLPGFIDRVFAAGPAALSGCTTAVGLGAIYGSVFLGRMTDLEGLFHMLLSSGVVVIAGACLFLLTESLFIAVPALAMVGYGMARSGIATQTLIQFAAADDVRGRVLSVFGLVFRGAPALASLLMGLASDAVGLKLPVLTGTMLLCCVWAWAFLRRTHMVRRLVTAP